MSSHFMMNGKNWVRNFGSQIKTFSSTFRRLSRRLLLPSISHWIAVGYLTISLGVREFSSFRRSVKQWRCVYVYRGLHVRWISPRSFFTCLLIMLIFMKVKCTYPLQSAWFEVKSLESVYLESVYLELPLVCTELPLHIAEQPPECCLLMVDLPFSQLFSQLLYLPVADAGCLPVVPVEGTYQHIYRAPAFSV